MTLVYYRDGNGKVIRHHLPPKGLTQKQLEEAVAEFNVKNTTQAFIQEIQDDSLEMHLFERAQYQRRFPKEVIQAALDAIEEARDAINCLEAEPTE